MSSKLRFYLQIFVHTGLFVWNFDFIVIHNTIADNVKISDKNFESLFVDKVIIIGTANQNFLILVISDIQFKLNSYWIR